MTRLLKKEEEVEDMEAGMVEEVVEVVEGMEGMEFQEEVREGMESPGETEEVMQNTTGDGGGYATTTGDGGGDTPIGGGRVHPAGANSNTGSMNTNGVADQKEEKCDRFVNWFKRLFDKSIKKCPKEVEEDMRRLRT
ncbi:hypothetical protein F442_11841 [Phytophthora nicotianae P10297]|uniref:Uncharacterized protein n=1 Tax=Phytophthora nicotianae P10297 TaxID=1317064 RepID=W2Z0U5_PHYNI|nr:hypothetical protein F442_11841 [Phytophthora nicotianae P10297]